MTLSNDRIVTWVTRPERPKGAKDEGSAKHRQHKFDLGYDFEQPRKGFDLSASLLRRGFTFATCLLCNLPSSVTSSAPTPIPFLKMDRLK